MVCVILVKLGRLSLGSSVKQSSKSGFDDLLSSVDAGGKNDYDWYLLYSFDYLLCITSDLLSLHFVY